MVITGTDRFFSVGLDIKYIIQDPVKNGPEVSMGLAALLCRILIFELPTIAALNGICVGGGMYLSLCCDYRLMKSDDNAFICIPVLKHGIGLPIGFADILRQKLPADTLRTGALTAKHYHPNEALKAKFIDNIIYECKNNEQFVTKCCQFGRETLLPVAKNRKNLTRLKYDLYYETYEKFKKLKSGGDVFTKIIKDKISKM